MTSSRTSPFPPTTQSQMSAMAAPAFLQQSQPFRPSNGQPSFLSSVNPFERDAAKLVGTPFANAGPTVSSVLIRRLPLNTSEESLRLMVVWSKELVDVELLPVDQSEDKGFRSAILTFRTTNGAIEAKNMLDGKSNISNDANMVVEILVAGSPTSSRRYPEPAGTGPSSTASSATSSAPTSRQPSRFNGGFQSLEKISPPMSGMYGTSELPNPESSAHYQTLFSPQSPIGNHITERTRATGKSMINNDAADDDDTGELLKDPVAYAENGATAQRRATAPQLPISRLANLSLNTNSSSGPSSSLPQYGQQGMGAMSAHPAAMSPTVMGGGPHGVSYHMTGGHPFNRPNFPPVNPADQNPPCNTLYVGNLPIDTSEEELKAMFSKQRGYKRLCFRTKQNGPMCFVEFEDVSFATKALHELYGHPLHNSVKGGIRLSFSKNPLGVRSGQTPGQATPPMSGMMTGSSNGLRTANGPPPGLSAPPGLGAGRYNGGSAAQSYTVAAGFPATGNSNVWNGYSGAMTAGGPGSLMNGNNSNYLPPHMLGR